MISEYLMTTRERQWAACVKLSRDGYQATTGDAFEGPTVIIEHSAGDVAGPEGIVMSVDQSAERY